MDYSFYRQIGIDRTIQRLPVGKISVDEKISQCINFSGNKSVFYEAPPAKTKMNQTVFDKRGTQQSSRFEAANVTRVGTLGVDFVIDRNHNVIGNEWKIQIIGL